MKYRKTKKKLMLNKNTVSNLDRRDMSNVYGGWEGGPFTESCVGNRCDGGEFILTDACPSTVPSTC